MASFRAAAEFVSSDGPMRAGLEAATAPEEVIKPKATINNKLQGRKDTERVRLCEYITRVMPVPKDD